MRKILILLILLLPVRLLAQINANTEFTVERGVIYCPSGIPESPRWFADGRLAFAFDEAGIVQLDYYNDVPGNDLSTIFLRQLWDSFRYYIELDGKTYKPVYNNSRIWPFGIESEWKFQDLIFKHRVIAVDQSLVIQLIVPPGVPEGLRFKLEFYEASALINGSVNDVRYHTGPSSRKWEPWSFDPTGNLLAGSFITTPPPSPDKATGPYVTTCLIGADFPIQHTRRDVNPKHLLKSPLLAEGNYSFVLSFGTEQHATQEKHERLTRTLKEQMARQYERYERVARNSPVLQSPYPELNAFVSLAPLYHEALKIVDHPGAIRAKTSSYWVWGWDGMTSNYASFYWGDASFIREMLAFYEDTADPQRGVGHAFGYDMKTSSISALPAQGMYISLLGLYYANTGDLETVRRHYPFAKAIFDRIAEKEVQNTGMCEGTSLFPDFPEVLQETGNDISAFNNTIFYCAARSMESLAAILSDKPQQTRALNIVRRFEDNFVRRFFNPERQFVVSSLDSRTLVQRDAYITNAIRWESNYCGDLTASIDTSNLQFFRKNAVTPMGLREIPLWNQAYDMDANQLHSWWPATGEYFMRLANGNNAKDLIDQWVEWVAYWTKHLSIPEGISYYIETSEPEFDRWTSLMGSWQAYSVRAWYQAALHGVVGVDTDAGGMTFYPYAGEEMKLTGLNFRNRKFDIEWKGQGRYIDRIEVDGVTLRATQKLPVDVAQGKDSLRIALHRTTTNPYHVTIARSTGIELKNYRYTGGVIRAQIQGAGLCRLWLLTDRKPIVRINGRAVAVRHDANQGTAVIETTLSYGKTYSIDIR
jgi:hypothetical protein